METTRVKWILIVLMCEFILGAELEGGSSAADKPSEGDSGTYYEVGTSPESQTIPSNSFSLVSQGYQRSQDTDLFQSVCELTIVPEDGARIASYKVSMKPMDIYSSPPCTYMMFLVNNLGTTMDTKDYCSTSAVPVTFINKGTLKQDASVHVAFLQQKNEATGRFRLNIEVQRRQYGSFSYVAGDDGFHVNCRTVVKTRTARLNSDLHQDMQLEDNNDLGVIGLSAASGLILALVLLFVCFTTLTVLVGVWLWRLKRRESSSNGNPHVAKSVATLNTAAA